MREYYSIKILRDIDYYNPCILVFLNCMFTEQMKVSLSFLQDKSFAVTFQD